MADVLDSSEMVDDSDWCSSAQKRVANGSDGLWVRCGPETPSTCTAHWFRLRFNPCVSCLAAVLLLVIVCVCVFIQPNDFCWKVATDTNGQRVLEKEQCYLPGIEFSTWQSWVTELFTWLYIITQDIWIAFVVVLFCSKYGSMKLGADDSEPEFSTFQWFAMVFSCGVGTGLFYFGVAEPIWHYTGDNRWKDLPPNKRAQEAMNTTFYHWGIHGWVCYAILGILLAFLHFRKGLPMTIKSCFFPLMGDSIYGFMGDMLDSFSVVATTMGVCTSLGLGVMQLNAGMERLNGNQHWMGLGFHNQANRAEWADRDSNLKALWDSWPQSVQESKPWVDGAGNVDVNTAGAVAGLIAENNQQIALIWIITGLATFSVMLGLKRGIAALASICLWLGMFLMVYVLLMDDTTFLLNFFVQSLGFYWQRIWEIGFYTGAFAQSEHSGGGTGSKGWMDGWTIFYWGWWIAWAPFVGVFLARIGKGRTIREFLVGTVILPVLYNFAWMIIFGGAGLKMQMAAENAGLSCDMGAPVNGVHQAPYSRNICRTVATDPYTTESTLFCSTISKLSCAPSSEIMLFDVLQQYADVGGFLTVLTMLSLVLYFVTSSDSGSMVDDIMTANGIPEPPLAQRLFWALTEGASATALLYAGRFLGTTSGGLKALQAASICVGLPYTFLICFMCVALWRALQYECGDRKWDDSFKHGILDIGLTIYKPKEGGQRRCNFQFGGLEPRRLMQVLMFIVAPWVGLVPTTRKLENAKKNGSRRWGICLVVGAAVCFYTFIIMWLVDYVPVAKDPYKMGSIMGNESDVSSLYYLSTRYGYYKEWGFDVQTPQTMIPQVVNGTKYGIDGLSNSPEHGEVAYNGLGVGAPIGRNGHFGTIAWFFFLSFLTIVAYVRFDVRVVFGIPGSIVEDFAVSVVYPFAISQMQWHVEDTVEERGSKGMSKNSDDHEPNTSVISVQI